MFFSISQQFNGALKMGKTFGKLLAVIHLQISKIELGTTVHPQVRIRYLMPAGLQTRIRREPHTAGPRFL